MSAPAANSPTDAQRRAAETLDRHVAVTAGPGSGKTRVLVARYLDIVEVADTDLERIVAITFTNKAAGQMRERVRREIDARILSTKGTARELVWRDRKRRLEGAAITTIHGFCSRLLRENPVEAVVDPQFATLDAYTQSVMLDAAAEAAVTSLVNQADETAARLVAAYGRGRLVSELIAAYGRLRNLGVSVDEAESATLAGASTAEDYAERFAELTLAVDCLASAPATETARRQIDAFLAAWDVERGALALAPSGDRALEFVESLERLRRASPEARARSVKPLVEALRRCAGTRDGATCGSLASAFFDVCAREFAPHLFGALRAVDALYGLEKRNAAALDYEDLQLRARDLLRGHPEVVRRVRGRYRYFLVDEFQDTNGLQRDVIELLALGEPRANLFIVGDRKQSIYGFRGAEVEVFADSIRGLQRQGGDWVALDVNFRSRPALVETFNGLFERLMRPEPGDDETAIEALGFVGHEPIRPLGAEGPGAVAVELLLDVAREGGEDGPRAPRAPDEEGARDREARRLADRLVALVEGEEPVLRDRREGAEEGAMRAPRYGDVAVLLRAITDVKAYERAFRRRGIPYYVVAGKGFYDRPEVVDLLNLVEFVDNRTDELALAAVLRSPLFGVSDETLLALRAGRLRRMEAQGASRVAARPLFEAARFHEDEELVGPSEHEALGRAVEVLDALLSLRNRLSISELLAEALRLTEYETVAAAAEDGAQRLSNVDKLVGLARGFERGGMRLLRDFVEFVREFRRLDAREAEALLRTDADAVAILTVHKSKGLEFPVVVLPDLQREFPRVGGDVLFDRLLGLAFKVPDGRGSLVKTGLYERVAERRRLRERFEAMRLLYVGATRAEDYLILSGASARKPGDLDGKALRDCGCWLEWLLAVTGVRAAEGDTLVPLGGGALRVLGPDVELARERTPATADLASDGPAPEPVDAFASVERVRRALGPVAPSAGPSLRRFGATELQTFANCPRQFYYGRLLRIPSGDGGASPSHERDKEAALPPTLRGVVLHRFCETLRPGDDLDERLRACLAEVLTARGDEYPELAGAAVGQAAAELVPYARNYAESRMRRRVDERLAAGAWLPDGSHEQVRSEVPFTLRTRHGLVTGAIDKVLLTPLQGGRVRALLVDFKTAYVGRGRGVEAGVARAAREHTLQMQVYAHAVRRLIPGVQTVEAALHFLQPGPNAEYHVPADLISESKAEEAIDRALAAILDGGLDPARFEARPAARCRVCRFAGFCPEARAAGSTA